MLFRHFSLLQSHTASLSFSLLVSFSSVGGFEFCSVQVQPPGTKGKADHVWAVKDVPLVPKLLEAGDTDAVSPAHPERRRDGVQSGLHKVCVCHGLRRQVHSSNIRTEHNRGFPRRLPGGSATATSPRATTACRAMKPLTCSGAACSSPSSRWPAASSWRSSEWRRTSCYRRNAHSSSHTFPSRLTLLKCCASAL